MCRLMQECDAKNIIFWQLLDNLHLPPARGDSGAGNSERLPQVAIVSAQRLGMSGGKGRQLISMTSGASNIPPVRISLAEGSMTMLVPRKTVLTIRYSRIAYFYGYQASRCRSCTKTLVGRSAA